MRWIYIFITITALFGQASLTMDEFLRSARISNSLWQGDDLAKRRVDLEKRALRGIDDWQLESDIVVSYMEPLDPYTKGFERFTQASVSGGLSRYFWNSGGTFTGGLNFSGGPVEYVETSPGIDVWDQSFEHSIYMSYTQPLLRNFRGRLAKIPYKLREFDMEMYKLEREDKREDLIVEAAQSYIDWAWLLDTKAILLERMMLAEKEYEMAQKKYDAHLIDEVDVLRAETTLETARLNLETLNADLTSHIAFLSVLTGRSDLASRKPTPELEKLPVLPNIAKLIRNFQSRSRLVMLLRYNIQQLQLNEEGMTEEAKRNLMLSGSPSLAKTDGDIAKSFVLDQPTVSVGLGMDFPLDKSVLRNEIAANRIAIEELELQIDVLEQAQYRAITRLHSKLGTLQPLIALHDRKIEAAQKMTEAEEELYRQGRSEYTFVIQAEDAELAAKLARLDTLREYHRLYHELLNLTDSFGM